MSATGSPSYGTPMATPSAGRSWVAGSGNSVFVTPNSLVSAASGTSWMSAADTLPATGMHQSAVFAAEAAVVDAAPRLHTPRLGPPLPPDSPTAHEWRRPRAVQAAVIVEVDDFNIQGAVGAPDTSVALHIQEVGAWEAGVLCVADGRASWSPPRGQGAVFSGARGTKLLHSVAASPAWPPPSARGPRSVASTLSRAPSMAGLDRVPSASAAGQQAPASPFRLPHVRPRPSSAALSRQDTLPRSARRSSSHLSRSGSLSLLQVQHRSSPFTSTATFDAPQFGPPPLVSISTCLSPMHSDIDITPLTVTVTPRLVEFAIKCGEPFERLLPQPEPATALPLPAPAALAAAADAAVDLAAAPQTVSLRVRGVAVGVLLAAPGPASAAGCLVVPHLSVDEVRVNVGSVADTVRVARLHDDLRTAHAHNRIGAMHVSGHSVGGSSTVNSGPDRGAGVGEGLAGELWAHAGAAGAVRLPDEALAAALTVPLHAVVAEVSIGLHERAGGVAVDDEGDWYVPDGMHDVTASVPVLTVSAAEVTARIPAAQFCPVDAGAKVTGVRGTVTLDDVARVQQVQEAAEKLAADVAPGWDGKMSTGASSAPWLQVRGVLDDMWLRVAGVCADDACVDATLTHANCSYDTPVPGARGHRCGGSKSTTVPHAWATCAVHINGLSVAQVSGKLEAVLPSAVPFVPSGIRSAMLRAVSLHVAVDPMTGTLQRLVGEACGLRVTADPLVSARSGFWDAAAGANVCVIGACALLPHSDHCCADAISGRAPAPAAPTAAAPESKIRFDFAAPGSSGGGSPTPAVTAARTAVLLHNVRVSTLFLAEVSAVVDAISPTEDRGRSSAGGGQRAADVDGPPACVSVEIVGCELVAPVQPAGGVREPGGDAAVKIGRVRVLTHPGWLDDEHAAAAAALADMRACARQAEWLKCVPADGLAMALRESLGGVIWSWPFCTLFDACAGDTSTRVRESGR